MLDKLDAALRFQQEALNLRAQRQEVLAANIANADTPGYQNCNTVFRTSLRLTGILSIWIANAPSLPITACNTR